MRRLPLCLTLAALCGCPEAPPPKPTTAIDAGAPASSTGPALKGVAEIEPNDSPQTAQPIGSSSRVSGQLAVVQPATRPDEDWYLIQPQTAPQDLGLALTGLSGKVSLEVYDKDHNKLLAKSGTPPLAISQVRIHDAVLVRVAAAGTPAAIGPYTLELTLALPDPDREAEPNDRAVDATPLPLDHPLHGTYGVEGDEDFFVVELAPAAPVPPSAGPSADAGMDAGPTPPQPADAGAAPSLDAGDANTPAPSPTEMLRVDLTGVTGIRQSITFLDESQAPLARFSSREPGDPIRIRDLPLRPGLAKIYVLLEALPIHKKRPASDQPYTLTIHREPAPANLELEPNDALDAATPLVPRTVPAEAVGAVSAVRVGYLSPEGDVDTYKVHLDAPARLHVILSALDRVDTELSVLEPDPAHPERGKLLLHVNEGGAKEPEVIPAISLGAGDHYLRVQAAAHQVGSKWVRDQEDPDQTYALNISLVPEDGAFEREPNDKAAEATPLEPGKPLLGYLFPARDVDVYKLDLSSQPVAAGATLTVTGVPKVPVALELRDGKDGALGELLNSSDPGKPGLDARLNQKLAPGIYYLVVRAHPAAGTAGTPQSDPETTYKISIQLE